MGLERPVHIAINHNPAAISMHEANHPGCLHLQTDVWDVDPVEVLAGRRIGWFHASPDCTHHSQAAGGQPRKAEIRNLSWVVTKWAGKTKPLILSLENVKQIRQWGPLIAKRCKKTGLVMKLDGTVAERGERVPRNEQFLVPDPKRRGKTWRRFLRALQGLGYEVEHQLLKACDFGAPTSRERLFLIARCDGEPIVWPKPTHAAKPARGQKPYRTAAECIDWSVPGKSIFNRPRPLADATMRRIAKGVKREVLGRAEPFIVPIANWSSETVQPVDQPLNTITAWPRGGSFAIASPVLTPFYGGERKGNRAHGTHEPLRTQTTENRFALVTAFMAQANGGFNVTHSKPLDAPTTTITNTGSQQQLVTANLLHLRGNCDARSVDAPLHTISAGGQLSPEIEEGALRCAAFLINYYGNGDARTLGAPADTLTTRDRLALVTVWISGDPYVIVDIHLRMLQPHELYAAQGFPSNYIIDRGHDGRKLTKSEQVHMCGNSVSPPPMAAIARANNPYRVEIAQGVAA
jgi:DNA (cytosine-5)-methyltransferase 1